MVIHISMILNTRFVRPGLRRLFQNYFKKISRVLFLSLFNFQGTFTSLFFPLFPTFFPERRGCRGTACILYHSHPFLSILFISFFFFPYLPFSSRFSHYYHSFLLSLTLSYFLLSFIFVYYPLLSRKILPLCLVNLTINVSPW